MKPELGIVIVLHLEVHNSSSCSQEKVEKLDLAKKVRLCHFPECLEACSLLKS